MITLTAEERRKLEMYLRQEAASYKAINDQMEKLPGMAATIRPIVLRVAALNLVANWLASGEEQQL